MTFIEPDPAVEFTGQRIAAVRDTLASAGSAPSEPAGGRPGA
jgi:hypothetical protein